MHLQFYTEGWCSDTSILDTLLSEDHVQVSSFCLMLSSITIEVLCKGFQHRFWHLQIDRVWGAGPKEGRERMKAGVAIFRRFYPDVKFVALPKLNNFFTQ